MSTVETVFSRLRKSRGPQIKASTAVALGAFSVGNVLGWSSPGLPSLQKSGHIPELTKSDMSWIGSIITIGALFGSILAGICIDKHGRKISLLIPTFPTVVGWACIVIAKISTFPTFFLLFGRFVLGVGMGFQMIVGPVYLSEIAEPDIRGMLTSTFSVVLKLGIVFTYFVGYFVNYQALAGICLVVPLLMFAATFILPESPRFYLQHQETQFATDSICWLHGCDKKAPLPEVLQELEELQNGMGENSEKMQSLYKRLSHWKYMKPLLVVTGIMAFNQLCMGNAYSFYTAMIFDSFNGGAGLLDSHLSSLIVSLFQLGSVTTMLILVDRVGRKALLIVMFLIMSLSLMTLGLMGYFNSSLEKMLSKYALNWISLVCFILLNAAYSGGPSVLSWTLMSELVPSCIMGFASAFNSGFNWGLAFLTTRFFHDIVDFFGQDITFFIFSTFSFLGAIYILVIVPETRGKSLENIQKQNYNNAATQQAGQ